MTMCGISRSITLAAICATAVGCTSLNLYPRDGEVVTGTQDAVPVTVRLEWPNDGRGMGPVVDVDGQYIAPPQLAYSRAGATTTVYLRPGFHTVRARSAQFCAICVGGIGQFDISRTFLVAQPAPAVSLTVAPTVVANNSDAK
jgi:hypothetical protein